MAKKSRRKLHSRFNKKTLLIVLAVLIALAGLAYARNSDSGTSYNPPTTPSANGNKSDVNYNPPTVQEKKDTEAYKQNLGNPPPPPPTTNSGKVQVTPIITSQDGSSSYDARAYVPGVFEDGGTCTATATKTGS
jgi:hypothetical protein